MISVSEKLTLGVLPWVGSHQRTQGCRLVEHRSRCLLRSSLERGRPGWEAVASSPWCRLGCGALDRVGIVADDVWPGRHVLWTTSDIKNNVNATENINLNSSPVDSCSLKQNIA